MASSKLNVALKICKYYLEEQKNVVKKKCVFVYFLKLN